MYTEMALRDEGMKILISNLGRVEAERFISLITREPFDYTEWQRELFNDLSVEELSNRAMKVYEKSTLYELPAEQMKIVGKNNQ